MPGIIFVQKEIEDKLGPMLLTSYLKSCGYEAEIIINPRKNINRIKALNPEFIGISRCSPSVDWTLSTCSLLKKNVPNSLVVLGGPHPAFFPQIIEHPGVDIVCIGEREKPILQLLQKYDGNISSIKDIPNLWVKCGSSIVKNPMCSLLTEGELSKLPFSDRSHYQQYSI